MAVVHVVYGCRACPYGNEGKGKCTWTLGKGNDEVVYEWPPPPPRGAPPPGAPPPPPGAPPGHQGKGKGNDEVVSWQPPPSHQGKGKDKGSWMWSPHSQGQGQGQGGRGYVWPPAAIVDAFIRKGKGKEDEDVEMSDDSQEMWDALIEERKGKGHVYP